jgi:integrase
MQYMKVEKIEDLLSSTDIRLIEARIISYLVHLKNVEKLSCGTANGYLAAIMLFYAVNDYTLNRKKISRYLPEPRKLSEDRGYNSDEIRLMLEGSDIRVRALILLCASTGIRIGSIADLKLKHLHKNEKYNLSRTQRRILLFYYVGGS